MLTSRPGAPVLPHQPLSPALHPPLPSQVAASPASEKLAAELMMPMELAASPAAEEMEYGAAPAAEAMPATMPMGEGVRKLLGTLTVRQRQWGWLEAEGGRAGSV